jgi:hypothetical protein
LLEYRRRIPLAGSLAAVLVLAVVTVLCPPLVAAATSTETGKMPARPLAQLVRDGDGHVWLVTLERHRLSLPDPETYQWYGGPRNTDELPRVSDDDLSDLPLMRIAPSLKEYVTRAVVAP